MHRLLTAAIVLLTVGFSTNSAALQLGSPEKASALGEPLQLRMEILANRYESVQGLSASIRPDLEYRADAAMNAEVAKLQAQIITLGNSRYVSVTSNSAVTSPVLAFRVRVGNDTEGFTRGYRVLLDPPISQLRRSRPQVVNTQAESSTASHPSASGKTYGPVKPGDTLWKIAKRLTESTGIKTATLVKQLHALNPQAFVNGDINRLRVDVMLQIPGSRDVPAATAPEVTVQDSPSAESNVTPEQTDAAELARAKQTLERARAYIIARQAELERLETQLQSARTVSSASQDRAQTRSAPPEPVAEQVTPVKQIPIETQTPIAAVNPEPAVSTSPTAQSQNDALSLLPDWWRIAALAILLALFAYSISKAWSRLMHQRRLDAAHAAAERQRVEAVAVKADRAEAFRRGDKDAIENTPEEARPQLEEPGHLVVELNDDTLTEADINIAYGRYQEAESALLDVLEQAPANYLARFKLAELYYTMRRGAEFTEVAGALAEQRAMLTDADWQRLVSMGQEVAPDEPLFGGLQVVVDRNADGAA